MLINSPFTNRFKLSGPIVLAPMAGGPTTPELVSAACNAGILGSLAGAYLNPEQLRSDIRRVKGETKYPFAVNLFAPIPEPKLDPSKIQRALASTSGVRRELGISDPQLHPPYHGNFDDQFSVVLSETPAVFSFTFGLIQPHQIRECRRRGIFTMGTVTSLEEGRALEDAGIDALVAQGFEAGGHRGMFFEDQDDPRITTMELTRQLARKFRIPIIASGGIMTGTEIANALRFGAQAAQLGTAFLLSEEAGTSIPYRTALLELKTRETRLTRAFSGRLARGIQNRFILEMEDKSATILPFPAQNSFTRDIRNEATKQSKYEFLSLWAGTGFRNIREGSVENLVRSLMRELLMESKD